MKFGGKLNKFLIGLRISFLSGIMIAVYFGQDISQLTLIIRKFIEMLLDIFMLSVKLTCHIT